MDNNNKKIFIMIISLALVVITGTFAWLSWRSQNTAMVLTIGDIRGLTVTLKPYQINSSLSPVSSYTDGIAIDVTVDNKKTEPDNFKLYYKIATIDSALIDSGFKYAITRCSMDCDNANNYSVLSDAEGSFASAASNSKLDIYQATIPANTTYKYKVYLWIDSSSGNQSNMQNKSFVGELRANIPFSSYTVMRDNAVMDNIKSTYVTATTGVNFNALSSNTNGKGIYIRAGTENDAHPIYYYRGAVTDNNVLFAGFCWKIVRTTSTGGTKLIYNGVPTDGICNNTGTASRLSTKSNYKSEMSAAYAGYMYGTIHYYYFRDSSNLATSFLYGNSFTYNNGTYTLVDTISSSGNWADDYNTLNNNHYTCFNTTGTCNTLYYIFFTETGRSYQMRLTDNKSLTTMFEEMFTNTTDSNIKTVIDNWYSTNMTEYTSYLEDTPWCNDRSIYELNGFNPNGGNTTKYLYFGAFGRMAYSDIPILTCNTNDAFTLPGNEVGNGKLTYPIGLLTADEIRFAGGTMNSNNYSYYLYTGETWYLGSPSHISHYSGNIRNVSNNGTIASSTANQSYGVRPSVSLKYGTKFSSGTGTATDPYVVE